jgi:hypothetical protein
MWRAGGLKSAFEAQGGGMALTREDPAPNRSQFGC